MSFISGSSAVNISFQINENSFCLYIYLFLLSSVYSDVRIYQKQGLMDTFNKPL
jgi:hypothetical protein